MMPNLGQASERRELSALRRDLASQAHQSAEAASEAKRLQAEYDQTLGRLRRRARQFEDWLRAVSQMKVGDTVAISRKPGKGQLLSVDLTHLRATVLTEHGETEVRLQELFPQSAAFDATRAGRAERRPGKSGRDAGKKTGAPRPMRRHRAGARSAAANRKAVLATPPGQHVYVVPFHTRATLIRINEDKDQAVVTTGAMEIQVPIADLAPVRDKP